MALCDSHSGSLWLLLTLSGFHWLSLALTGSLPVSLCSLWLSVTPTLALTGSHCHSLAYAGSLLLSNFAYRLTLTGPLLGSHRRCHNDALFPALLLLYVFTCLKYISNVKSINFSERSPIERMNIVTPTVTGIPPG